MPTDPTTLFTTKNTKDKDVIQKIFGILAEHFERLSVSQEREETPETSNQTTKPLIEEVLSPEEEAMQKRVNNILADEKVRNALQDEEVHAIIESLRNNPEKGHQLAAQASKDVKEKIRLLIQNGVLAFQ
nr:expressed protein [Hymenolepis microstoma]